MLLLQHVLGATTAALMVTVMLGRETATMTGTANLDLNVAVRTASLMVHPSGMKMTTAATNRSHQQVSSVAIAELNLITFESQVYA